MQLEEKEEEEREMQEHPCKMHSVRRMIYQETVLVESLRFAFRTLIKWYMVSDGLEVSTYVDDTIHSPQHTLSECHEP
jgi:hypothetical protein